MKLLPTIILIVSFSRRCDAHNTVPAAAASGSPYHHHHRNARAVQDDDAAFEGDDETGGGCEGLLVLGGSSTDVPSNQNQNGWSGLIAAYQDYDQPFVTLPWSEGRGDVHGRFNAVYVVNIVTARRRAFWASCSYVTSSTLVGAYCTRRLHSRLRNARLRVHGRDNTDNTVTLAVHAVAL